VRKLIQSLKAYLIFSVVLGLVYPLFVTFIAKFFMPYKANGSLMIKGDQIVGSELVGQSFTKPWYFQSRPSACGYDASRSGATNFGPSSKKLMDNVAGKIARTRKENGLGPMARIPGDMVQCSSSGLDPHISKKNALIQFKRVAILRKMPENVLVKLIDENTDPDFIGIWGRQGVNILKLNLALDAVAVSKQQNKIRN